MKVRELTNGELEACRQKADRKVTAFLATIEKLSETEKFGRLHVKFESVSRCTALCADNFDPIKFVERGNDNRSPDELAFMQKGHAEGVYTMELLRDAMKTSPLAKVNGTSSVFAECAALTGIEIDWLPKAGKTERPLQTAAPIFPGIVIPSLATV